MKRSPTSPARSLTCACAIALAGSFAPPVHAETLRCIAGSAAEGDSRVSVLYKCGEPLLKDNFCAPLHYGPDLQLVPQPWAGMVVPCQAIEEWLYDRGPGYMVATLRFRAGVLQSIRYSRSPR